MHYSIRAPPTRSWPRSALAYAFPDIMAVTKQKMSSKPKPPIRLPMLPIGLWTHETHRGSEQQYWDLSLWQCQWLSSITKIKWNAWTWYAELLCLVTSKKHCWIYAGLITGIHVNHRHHLHYSCRTLLTPGDLLHEATSAWTRLHIICKQKMVHGKEKWVLQWLGKQHWLHQCFNSDRAVESDLEMSPAT